MKVKIEYEYNTQYGNKYWAKIIAPYGKSYSKGGRSWIEARQAVLEEIKLDLDIPDIPQDEEVEI